VRAWILYSALRVGVFLLLFALLFALTSAIGWNPAWLIAACAAALLALCISYIFFRPLRDRVALDVAAARTGAQAGSPRAGSDEDAEDAARGD
jgi:inner membrane protein involved in colicin E2 resistance